MASQPNDTQIPPTIVPAITAIAGVFLMCYSLRRRPTVEEIPILVTSLGILLGTLSSFYNNRKDRAKVKTAESLVPGITTPSGPIAAETIITNDPSSPLPPVVISTLPKGNTP